ncbi:hypothetical protein [Sandaracinobacteroides hominis]|uniref:hypothetical protein n=1 Tax=Sandaracinobacteroides hominis TaxID=2780086 RepID=UPI0018F3D77E|nr:hypothetical protein [Sandaracinobacteroides hominis]
MAYRDFSDAADARMAARTDTQGFTDLEWSVVAIARRDPLSSIEAPGRLASKLDALLGRQRTPRLADPRLEALRRFVVVDHHMGKYLPDREIAHFVGAGFSQVHVHLLRSASSNI